MTSKEELEEIVGYRSLCQCGLFVLAGYCLLMAFVVAPYYKVHSGLCTVTSLRAQQVIRTEDGCNENLIQHQCDKCFPWPSQCCTEGSLARDTCLRLTATLTDCVNDNCTKFGDSRVYDGVWELEDQQNIRGLLQPNRTFKCYWSGFDGYLPYKPGGNGIVAAYVIPSVVLGFCVLLSGYNGSYPPDPPAPVITHAQRLRQHRLRHNPHLPSKSTTVSVVLPPASIDPPGGLTTNLELESPPAYSNLELASPPAYFDLELEIEIQ